MRLKAQQEATNSRVISYNLFADKTGTHQYTRAVWSTFAEIHSRYIPRFIDALYLSNKTRLPCLCSLI